MLRACHRLLHRKSSQVRLCQIPGVDQTLTTQMKSVGEVMAIGRTFKEALQKALRSLEQDRYGWGADGEDEVEAWEIPSGERKRVPGRR